MYTPTTFAQDNADQLSSLIEAYSFGLLIVPDGAGGAEISHLPFVLDSTHGPHGKLLVHVARANPIWKVALERQRAIAVFSGPHAYISPQWYEVPRANVPTWNYAVAHVHGRVTGPMERHELLALLDRLVDRYESNSAKPWQRADLDTAIRDNLLNAIVGFSLAIDRIEGKFKLSQNRSPADREHVRDELMKRHNPEDVELARLMAR